MQPKPITIFEVLHDTNGDGPAGDGTVVARFRAKSEAEAFADKSTCYGRQAKAEAREVSRPLARRWGLA